MIEEKTGQEKGSQSPLVGPVPAQSIKLALEVASD